MAIALSFVVFVIAVGAMAVGVALSGRRLSSSCGGVVHDGESVGDCVCVRKDAGLCGDESNEELVHLAELGWPRPRHDEAQGSGDRADAASAAHPSSDRFEV